MFARKAGLLRSSLFAVCFLPCVLLGSPKAHADLPVPPAQVLQEELARVGVERFTSADYHPGLVRHIVMFRYALGVSDAQKAEIRDHFLALRHLCLRHGHPYVLSIETGTQRSGEGADYGLEQAFIVTFSSEGDRNYYVGQPVVTDASYYDPAHQAFKNFVAPFLNSTNGAVVFDYYLYTQPPGFEPVQTEEPQP
jgi:hypothetical protein